MRKSLFFLIVLMFSGSVYAEKDRLAVMDVTDEDGIFAPRTIVKVTDYIFSKLQETKAYWMVPMADRDNALEQAIEETVKGSRKECVDEKCQLSLVAQLQANYLINTKIKKLYENTCQISISKFDVEKRAGVDSWEEKFNCTEKGLYETIDQFNFGGEKEPGNNIKREDISDKNACKYAKEKNDLGIWEKYIERYPKGECEFEATVRIEELKSKKLKKDDSTKTDSDKIIPPPKEKELKKPANLNTKDLPNWSKKAPKEMNWNDAKKYCANLNEDGYSDWRLPTISELRTLIQNCSNTETGGNCNVTDSCLLWKNCRNDACNGCSDASSKLGDTGWFWSSSERSDYPSFAWKLDFSNGNVHNFTKDLLNDVRCVRTHYENKSQPSSQPIKFRKHSSSGLNWSNKASKGMNWFDADKYCTNLIESGYTDWRLPTISELRTLIKNCPAIETGGTCKVTDNCLSWDKCRNDSCSGCKYFEDGRYSKLGDNVWLWSSSESDNPDYAWNLDFSKGDINNILKYFINFVMCVR